MKQSSDSRKTGCVVVVWRFTTSVAGKSVKHPLHLQEYTDINEYDSVIITITTEEFIHVYQCFSTFSVKWNPLQQFWLLTEPVPVLGGLLGPEGPKFKATGQQRGTGSWGGGSEPPPHQLGGLGERCKLPQRGSGRAPSEKHFGPTKPRKWV